MATRWMATCDDCPDWQEIAETEALAERAAVVHAGRAHTEAVHDDAETMVRAHLGFAHHFARAAKVLPGETYDEVYADALVGLWDAARRWDPAGGAKFTTFAARRIHGEIIDGRRRRDPRSGSGRSSVTLERPLSLDALIDEDSQHTLLDVLPDSNDAIAEILDDDEHATKVAWVRAHFVDLTDNQAYVIDGLLHGRRLADLGAELGVTESRACQLKHKAIERLQHLAGRELIAA